MSARTLQPRPVRVAHAVAWICLLVLPLGAGSCRKPPPAVQRERQELTRLYGKDARLIFKAPACSTSVSVPTTGWKPAKVDDRPLGFTVPRAFYPDTAPHFAHGGYRWTDGDREFDSVRGDWQPRAFVQDPADGCRTMIAGHPVLVVRSLDSANRLTLTVWPYKYVPPAGYGTMVEVVSPSVQDDPLLLTMASGAVQAILADTAGKAGGTSTPGR